MNLSPINSAMQAAFDAALQNPQKVAPTQVGDDSNQTVQTVVYEAPTGSGFRVVGRIKVSNPNNETGFGADHVATKVLNHGPDEASVKDWPTEGIEVAAEAYFAARTQRQRASKIKAAEAHVLKWFTPLGVSALQDKLLEKKEAGELANYPKLVAVYTWMKTIQATALAGSITFPDSPHTFDEVLAE
jgi:hypothetical protein